MSFMQKFFSGSKLTLRSSSLHISGGLLVSVSVLFNPITTSNQAFAASDNKMSAGQESAAHELVERTAQLKVAEALKKDRPDGYILALTTMSAAVRGNDLLNNNKQDSPEADKYYDLAVDCLLANNFDKDTTQRLATHLWQTSGTTSLREFRAVFDKLCKACNRQLGDDFGSIDSDMRQSLQSHSTRNNELSMQEQMKFTERALAIRSAALGARSKTLSMLNYSLGRYHEDLHEYPLAERCYLRMGELDGEPSAKASRWQVMADYYLRRNEVAKAMNAWRQYASITGKQHLNFYTDGEINSIKEFRRLGHPEYADEIVNTLLADGNASLFERFDGYLLDSVDQNIRDANFKKAQDLVQKRIAAGVRIEAISGLTDWKIRLSNVYLAQGKSAESDALFRQVVGSMALQGLPTDDLRRDRAKLLERLGNKVESEKLKKVLPKASTAIVMVSPMMASGSIVFGHNVDVAFFDSADPSDKTLDPRAVPRIPRAPRAPLPPGSKMPHLPDDESILCLGPIRMEGNFSYGGKFFCRDANNVMPPSLTTIAESVPAGFTINDALPPPQGTPALTSTAKSGDYTATDPMMQRKVDGNVFRIFLIDSPDKREFELNIFDNASIKQLQVWYNGYKKITLQNFSGFVYAPNAVVEIGFNSTFKGAVVAKKLICAGNNKISLDKAVVKQNF